MSGTPLSEFTTFAASTGPHWASSPEQLINDATRNTTVLTRWMTGKDVTKDLIRGGSSIKDMVFLDNVNTFQRVNPNVTLTAPNPQTGDVWEVPWSFATATIAWTEPEIDLQAGGMTGKGRMQVYKRVLYQKHQNAWTGITATLDNELIGNRPNQLTQEATTGLTGPRDVLSIHVFVNEYNTSAVPYADGTSPAAPLVGGLNGAGLFPTGIDVTGALWQTVQQINPTTSGKTNWRPYQGTYGTWQNGSPSIDKNASMQQLFIAMSEAQRATEIDQIAMRPEYSTMRTQPDVIYTGKTGIAYYEQALRGNQDQFRGVGKTTGQDPDYNGPTFGQTPIQFISAMDTVQIYATSTASGGGSAVTELDATAVHVGPRFIGLNGNHIKPVFHEEKYFVMTDPITPSDMPMSRVQYFKLWNNNYCASRRRHWHLRPNLTPAA